MTCKLYLCIYMRLLLVMSFFALGLVVSAQFNTIGPPSTCRVRNSQPEAVSGLKKDTVGNNDMSVASTNLTAREWCHPPLKGSLRVSSGFGKRRNPFGKRTSENHAGLDISAKSGTPVYAMLPGEVAHVGYDHRSGNYIKLRHGSFTVSYCHLIRKPDIRVGSRVIPGQIVAHVGSTGRSTGPHLHITLKRNGRVLDPAILLDYISKQS